MDIFICCYDGSTCPFWGQKQVLLLYAGGVYFGSCYSQLMQFSVKACYFGGATQRLCGCRSNLFCIKSNGDYDELARLLWLRTLESPSI